MSRFEASPEVALGAAGRPCFGAGAARGLIRNSWWAATHVLAILSLAAVHSAWVRKEVQQSLKAGKPMIPVLLPVGWGYGSKRKRTESAVTGNLSCLPD